MVKFLRFFSIFGIGLIFVSGMEAISVERSYGNEDIIINKDVVISNRESYLKAIEEAEGFLVIGSEKIQENLLPQGDILESIKKATEKPCLKDRVFVIIEGKLTEEEKREGEKSVKCGDCLKQYKKLGVQLIESSDFVHATHSKILISEKYALVGTTNFDEEIKEDTVKRDFVIVTTQPELIQELKRVIDGDRRNERVDVETFEVDAIKEGETKLTWGPGEHRIHFKELIKGAKESIEIYQQALQDEELSELLMDAVKRGVNVSILMSEFPFGPKHGNKSEKYQQLIVNTKSYDGKKCAQVKLTGELVKEGDLAGKKLHIHAKVMIVDGLNPKEAIMYLGSTNFYTPALDKDRNVGIITKDSRYIIPVQTQFKKDWKAH